MKTLYEAEAVATGDGRNGHARSTDGILDIDLAMPVSMGGSGDATNPEQLFAAGYAACFHSSLITIGRRLRLAPGDSTVTAHVTLGSTEQRAYQLAVRLVIDLPNLDRPVAEELAEAAHQQCPYSHATRGNIDVTWEIV
ncbi:organic hydroperoxide resistance protein [Solirubrobacter phytolaccae]|uniref:Organic hydroperoxide resistance protein n=1 Tax=Solirubrobacter phytolaccae TaxID=1404360 RepID=A0A9X3SG03_9ACTN|nr:organic hydroperoxide resistance protein [Solirubrobacter phytolaccae]MDA0181967.1 organic hydroperoxide resistance protein [Solirubrobacter phytolaccae]